MFGRVALIAIIGVVVFGIGTAFAYLRDMTVARMAIESGSLVADTACGPIEYASVGDHPRTVLLVHGAGGGFNQAMGFVPALNAAGFRAVLMSRFGYLRTPLPEDASAEAQADAHACLLDALGIAKASILGASAGAPSTLQFAIRHPDRTEAVILLVPASYAPKPEGLAQIEAPASTAIVFDTALRMDFLFWAAIKTMPSVLTKALLATDPKLVAAAEPAEKGRAEQMLASILPVSPRRLGLVNDGKVTSTIGRYDFERVVAPTLAISAADDLFGTYDIARYTSEQIPHARFVGFPDGGHIWIGHDAEMLGLVTSFLTSVAPTAREAAQ